MFVSYQLRSVFALHMRIFFDPRGFFHVSLQQLTCVEPYYDRGASVISSALVLGLHCIWDHRSYGRWTDLTQIEWCLRKDTFSTLDPQRILIGVRRRKYYSSTLRSIDVDLWDDVSRIHVASTNVKSQFTRNIRGTHNVVLGLRRPLSTDRLY